MATFFAYFFISLGQSGMLSSPRYTYYIKQSSASSYTTASATNVTTSSYTFSGLTQGTSYDVRVVVDGDIAGNTGTGTLPNQTTGEVTSGLEEGAITFGTASWSDNRASITVSTNTSYDIEYQVGGITGSWTDITSGGTISNLSYGTTVYARLTDGYNRGDYASITIGDSILPQNTTINLSGTSTTTASSVTATVTMRDNESGVNWAESKWIYNTNAGNIGTNESSYTNTFSSNGQTITLSATNPGTYYLHVLTKDLAGNKRETISEAVTIEEPTIEEILTEGDWVRYEDGTGVTRECVVLYGPENANYKDYGIQIITMETVEDIELGNGTGSTQENNTTYFNIAMNSYNNAISTLNNETSKYLNTTYAESVRSVGSVPDNPSYEAGMFTSSYSFMSRYNGMFKDGDKNYLTDYLQMGTLNIRAIDEQYWLASRYVTSNTRRSIFCVNSIRDSDSVSHRDLCNITSSGDTTLYSITYGLRPVFTLKSGIKVTGGSGVEGDPYTLGT